MSFNIVPVAREHWMNINILDLETPKISWHDMLIAPYPCSKHTKKKNWSVNPLAVEFLVLILWKLDFLAAIVSTLSIAASNLISRQLLKEENSPYCVWALFTITSSCPIMFNIVSPKMIATPVDLHFWLILSKGNHLFVSSPEWGKAEAGNRQLCTDHYQIVNQNPLWSFKIPEMHFFFFPAEGPIDCSFKVEQC